MAAPAVTGVTQIFDAANLPRSRGPRGPSPNEVPPRAASNASPGVPALGVFLGALEHGDPQTAAR